MKLYSVEKIGGTSMSDYVAVRDNIIKKPTHSHSLYHRIFVVSAYSNITNLLLEDKKNGLPGVYALFANSVNDDSWHQALQSLKSKMFTINASLFGSTDLLKSANAFIGKRLDDAEQCLADLKRLCQHGHFVLSAHLASVREMLASIGEAHSAWNTATLLKHDGINARFVDLTNWRSANHNSLEDNIKSFLKVIDLDHELPIVTGYVHSKNSLVTSFGRGYSEITFSQIGVLTQAQEALIHKEFHLSSADPNLVGESNSLPIGRTNYDVVDQLANLGMEAIHPKAAKGLRKNNIPLRVKNTFEPEHNGTLITADYISDAPCVEIISGCKGVYALELFDPDMSGNLVEYDREILEKIHRFKAHIVSKDINANTITHYLSTNLKTIKRIRNILEDIYPEAEINQTKVAIVSVIGSNMQIPSLLANAVSALADDNIQILAIHQSMRQVDIQFVINEVDYDSATKVLHTCLIKMPHHRQVTTENIAKVPAYGDASIQNRDFRTE